MFGFGALGICLIMALITFAIYYIDGTSAGSGIDIEKQYQSYLMNSSMALPVTSMLSLIEPYLMVIVNTWLIGSVLFFLKFTTGYVYLKRIVKKAIPNKTLTKSLKKIKSKYRINRDIIIKESIDISTPIVMGIVKPIILFPMGLVNQLTISEVNAILAHELAHIKRHDYFFNLLQILVETIFYFHPAIWYISNVIRNERENCCDDMAIDHSGNNISYAKTLVKLQELNVTSLQPSLGFSGSKNTFKKRILRILNQSTTKTSIKDKVLVAMLLFTTLFVTAENYHTSSNDVSDNFDVYIIDDCPQSPEDIKFYLDTIPERNSFHIKKRTGSKDLELEMENGEIKSLKINGTEVAKEDIKSKSDIIKELVPDQNRDIITLFPECGDFGKVYLLEKLSRKAVNMDSVLEVLRENYVDFPQWQKENSLNFNFEDYDDIMIDTIKDGVKYFSFEKHYLNNDNNIFVDSIWDLFPHKLPSWSNSNEHPLFKNKIPGRIKELFEGTKKKRSFDNLEEKRDEYFFKKHSFPDLAQNENALEELFLKKKNDFTFESDNVANIITKRLLKDELIDETGNTKVEITGKNMKVDGEKQPTNIWKKYKKVYERETGIELTKDSKIVINISDVMKENSASNNFFFD